MLSGRVVERPSANGYERLQVRVRLLQIRESLVLGNVRGGRRYNRKRRLENFGISACAEESQLRRTGSIDAKA